VTLELSKPEPVDLRIWIDLVWDSSLSGETELSVEQREPCAWGTTFEPDSTQAQRFYYRIGVGSDYAMAWHLRIRERTNDVLLVEDGDEFDPPKAWILGSVPRVRVPAADSSVSGRHPGWRPSSRSGVIRLADYRARACR
jgi:hypothetical protein